MAVFRVHKEGNFTAMSNVHLRDEGLTLKAKGLLSVILSLPEDWKYSIAGLSAICKEGQSAVTSALHELSDAGYVVISKLYPGQTGSGRIEYVYDIYETPKAQVKQDVGFLPLENQGLEVQGIENRQQLNKEELSTDNQKNNKGKGGCDSAIEGYTDDPELREALVEFVKMRKLIKAPMTDRAVKLLFTNLDKLASDTQTKVAILNQSIANSWKGVFALRDAYSRPRKEVPRADFSNYVRDGEYVVYEP